MLEQAKPDIVHVTTPAPTHFRLALDALEQDAHVIVEKPITTQLEELKELSAAAAARGRFLIEDHNYLFNEMTQRVQALVRSGRLGRVVHVEAAISLDVYSQGSRFTDRNLLHPALRLPGGIISDFLTHLAYMVYPFLGGHRSVQASWTRQSESDLLASDELRALVEGERATALLLFSGHTQPDAFWLRVLGTQMQIEAHLWEPRMTVERLYSGARPLMPLRNGLARACAEWRGAWQSLWRKLSGGPGSYEGLWELLRQTYRALQENKAAPLSMEHIYGANRLMHDCLPPECSS
jgi:predicted dehydrogenase